MDHGISRRELLACGSAWVAAIHAPIAIVAPKLARTPVRPFIRRIRLTTTAQMEKMEEFYCSTLGFRRIGRTVGSFTLACGSTELEFRKGHGGKPLTHFAFNVPQNQIRSCLEFAHKRVDVIPAWGDLRDPAYPKEIVHFRHWNAHSIFFFDPALNVVEFIARHGLDFDSKTKFEIGDVQCVSEIGLPTKDPVAMAKRIQADLGVKAYPTGTSPQFAMGEENGLLLCLREGQEWGMHTKTPIEWGAYETEVEIVGQDRRDLNAQGLPYSVAATPPASSLGRLLLSGRSGWTARS